MARKSVAGFRPDALRLGEMVYSEEYVDAIIKAAGGLPDGLVEHRPAHESGEHREMVARKTALWDRLESAANSYLVKSELQLYPTPKQRLEAFVDIEKKAAALLSVLDVVDGDIEDFPSTIQQTGHKSGDDYLLETIDGVSRLRTWADQAAPQFRSRRETLSPSREKRHSDALAKIEKKAAILLKAFHVTEGNIRDVPSALRHGGLSAIAALEVPSTGHKFGDNYLLETIVGIGRLRKWARLAAGRIRSRGDALSTPREKRHLSEPALDLLFGEFAGIWIEIFNRRNFATSVGAPLRQNEGQAGGPFIRFVQKCLRPIPNLNTPSGDAVRSRTRRLFPVKLT